MTSRRFPWQRAVMSFVRWDELQCAQVVAESTQPGECSSPQLAAASRPPRGSAAAARRPLTGSGSPKARPCA